MFDDGGWNSSYIRGFDYKHTNTETYYFTFYSEFGERGVAVVAEAVVLSVTLVASIVTNLAFIVPLVKGRHRTVTNHFLLNLGFADILFAIGIPAVVVVRINQKWPLGDLICRLLPYSQLVCGFMVLWSLTFVSIERYRCLTLDPQLRITSNTAKLLIAILWIFALALFSPITFWFRHEESLNICTLRFPKAGIKISLFFTIITTLFTCIIPICILVFNYHRIFMKMVENRQRWELPTVLNSSLSRQEEARVRKHIRIMRVALFNMLVVLAMWLPITVVLCLIYVDGDRPLSDNSFFLRSHHFIYSLTLALVNTAVNPFLSGVIRFTCSADQSQGISKLLRLASSFN
ncbi:free fatty acid receptor 4-like [Cimex lectularius]|uniref:G-protein coupled receptors family 1 profile domain-containing protein n=1 Tax=Cimex lectularius TaxID=79782 RepID=A0A8I6RNF4_CIMLE|nr:free fatty acid receptor 4-like [Cimex lectularius]